MKAEETARADYWQKAASALSRERDDWKRRSDKMNEERLGYMEAYKGIKQDLEQVQHERDELNKEAGYLEDQNLWLEKDLDRLRQENEKLRTSLAKILTVTDSSPVKIYQKMEDIAREALREVVG